MTLRYDYQVLMLKVITLAGAGKMGRWSWGPIDEISHQVARVPYPYPDSRELPRIGREDLVDCVT